MGRSRKSAQPEEMREPEEKPGTRPTIARVAKLSGVAPSTVSHILTNRPGCYASAQTRERVMQVAKEIGYQANLAARALRGGASMTLGFVVPTLEFEATSAKCVAFEAAARAQGYLTTISFNPGDSATEDRVIQSLRQRQVDGIVIYPSRNGPHEELTAAVKHGPAVVTLTGDTLDLAVDDVSLDYSGGGRLQAEHLLKIGRKKPWFMTLDSGNLFRTVAARVKTLSEGLAEAGLTLRTQFWDTLTNPGPGAHVHYKREFAAFIKANKNQIDSIVTSNDDIGMLVLQAAREVGLRVPEDIAVIGYDNASIGRSTLTTVFHDNRLTAQTSLDFLLDRVLKRYTGEPRRVVIPAQLIVRESTVVGAGI